MTCCLGSRQAPLDLTLSLKQLFGVISIEICDSKRPQGVTRVFEDSMSRWSNVVLFSLLITTNLRHEWTRVAPQCHPYTLSPDILIPDNSLPFQPQRLIAHVLCSLPTQRGEWGGGGGGERLPFLLHLLIPKSKPVSTRNELECVSLTFFMECIRTSCRSNLKQSAAHLIESSP